MKTNIIPIGNSKGIRIPKVILDQCHIQETVILEIEQDKIIIMPEHNQPRNNWAEAFKRMHETKEDKLLVDDSLD
ncbi:MAG: AbrB/MazE/SpoVT family DNA-binding domain-containing protein [bacterium]|nr:AbrB/MazE/SpoVT family DNA-binding domain-containing protein [bacterium]